MAKSQPKVFLLGRVTLEVDGAAVEERGFAGRQGRLLFAYLVSEAGRPVPRDEIAEVLWGGDPPATWDKALTVLASKVRGVLAGVGVDDALTGAFGCYRLELPHGTWVDVDEASEATAAADTALKNDDPARATEDASRAEPLLRETFLPGEHGDWVEARRRELADLRSRLVGVLAEASLQLGDAASAVAWAEQAVALDPFRESAYRRLIDAHAAAGDRAEALRVYERCRRLLAEELGAYPSPETESMYRELLEAPSKEVETVASDGDDRAGPVDPGSRARRRLPVLPLVAAVVLGVAVVAAVLAVLSRDGSSDSSASTGLTANSITGIDASTARPSVSISLAASPTAVAFGGNSLWVAMPNQDSVSRIDPETSTVQQTIQVGSGPTGIAVGGGLVWVANSLDGTISRIDPRANGGQVVDTIPVGNGPVDLAFGLGGVWVANSLDHTVVRVDPVTDKPGRRFSIDAGADAIAVGDRAVWVTSREEGILSRVDPSSGRVTPIHVGNGPAAVAVAASAVWVANSQDATVWKVDPATNRVVGTVSVGEGPSGIAVERGGTVWVSNETSGTLSKIDPAAGKVVGSVAVGEQPQDVAAGPSMVYVAARGTGTAHRGGTLTVAVANPPGVYEGGIAEALDPALGYGEEALTTLTNDGLLGYGRLGGTDSHRVVPDLAVALPTITDGGRTYTFQLRPGIHYSTGALVQPADIRRGIVRALLLNGGAPPGSYLNEIVGADSCLRKPPRCDLARGIVTHHTSSTITFHLKAPDPDFLYKLALPVAVAVPPRTPLHAAVPLPATGPYRVASYDAKRGVIRLVRNPRFHLWSAAAQPDGFPDRIVEKYGYTGERAVGAVENGEADITADGPDQTWSPPLASMLRRRYASRLFSAPDSASAAVWLNTRLAPFDDVRVRRALEYAVDRNHLLALAGGPETARTGCQVLPPNTDGYRRYCPYTVHPNSAGSYTGPDLAKARRLVAASGTRGQRVTIWFYDIPTGHRNGAYLVSVLRSLGFDARLRTVPHRGSTWRPNRQAGVGGWASDYPAASQFFLPLFTCRSYSSDPNTNANTSGLCNPRIDAEIARARTIQLSDPARASRLWTKIDREITDLAPWVVIRAGNAVDFVSRRTGNYTPCWLSYWNGTTGACLDQLWVR
jgi:peptide/nickel transport system substrate-binding protein